MGRSDESLPPAAAVTHKNTVYSIKMVLSNTSKMLLITTNLGFWQIAMNNDMGEGEQGEKSQC